MKGKIVSLKIVLTLLVILTAGFCFALNDVAKNNSQKETTNAAYSKVVLGRDNKEYSALVSGDIVLSVEKVLVNSNENENVPIELAGGTTFPINGGSYTFMDTDPKAVVEDGTLVSLNNQFNNNKYEVSSGRQEAIMVSFGLYVYDADNNGISIADDAGNINAKMTELDVKAKRNKEDITNLPLKRECGNYFDFAFLITQEENNSNEGFYEFDFTYMANWELQTAHFEFYVVNKLSYNQQINPTGINYGYNAHPTLGWLDNDVNFERSPYKDTGYVLYNIGLSGKTNSVHTSYPTLTYDYTRYEISYVHNANKTNTSYTFKADLSVKPAKLIATIVSGGITTQKEFLLADYNAENDINLVSIMLTEAGTYTIEGKYLYKVKGDSSSVPDMGFENINLKLAIQGLSANYSKTDFAGSKMQYYKIAKQTNNQIDLVIPNGYEKDEDISSLKDQKLGFVYSFVEVEGREGTIISGSEDALLNIANRSIYESISTDANINKMKTIAVDDSELDSYLASINYPKTNQASIWLEGNDKYTNDSFYFYNPTRIDVSVLKNITHTNLTNTTSFKAKGYYLVFVKVDVSEPYWQIFAFQYTSSSINLEIEAFDDQNNADPSDDTYTPIAKGKYTNKKVRVTWQTPGIFDRAISPYYYSANANLSKEDLLKLTKNKLEATDTIKNGINHREAVLGTNVADGTFVKYLIRLESEGESATHEIFTIDKQAISGVKSLLVEEMNMGNSKYYALATDVNSNPITILQSITDGYATITWDNKESGAETFAEYSYIPFEATSDDVTSIKGNNGKEWITTKHKLKTLIKGTDLFKYADRSYVIKADGVLRNEGIYLITISDSAGNKCDYVFVIDRTNNYFKIDGLYYSNSYIISDKDVEYSVGDYKVFQLDLSAENALTNYIKLAAKGKLSADKNYYNGKNSNASSLSSIFQVINNNQYYLTVANSRVVGFENSTQDNSINGLSGTLQYVKSAASYYKRTLYTYGINHIVLNANDEKEGSYIVVEINKDNARGYVYYTNNDVNPTNIPLDGKDANNLFKLVTGSDSFSAGGFKIDNGINKAHATSANHLVFTWKLGAGKYTVTNVFYSYYKLTPTLYQDNDKYFYQLVEKDISIYNELTGWGPNSGSVSAENGYVIFNGNNNTKDGLYVITREYNAAADVGEDDVTKNYYFMVDRNRIIDVTAEIGRSIKINLMEEETEFRDFSSRTNTNLTFSYSKDKIDKQPYNIYLTTSKLPATFTIPTGKYYINSTQTSAKYYAGQLNVSVYFKDTESQLSGVSDDKYKDGTVKIFESYDLSLRYTDLFEIDIYKYLTDVDIALRDRLTVGDKNGNWLFLPGVYIVRISDNVVNGTGSKITHEKYIGLEIAGKNNYPEVDAFNGPTDAEMGEMTFELMQNKAKATVSQEYLKVVLPKYNPTENAYAQIDPNYLVVKQFYGEGSTGELYINHPYEPKNGISLKENSKYVTVNNDDSISIWLDTKLRSYDGEIDLKNLDVSLYYEISVRYKLNQYSSSGNYEKYKDCYVYYDGSTKHYYFERTFTITIDREAPENNVKYLQNNDSLILEYNQLFKTEKMIDNGSHQLGTTIYFTKQYSKYYSNEVKDMGYVYAFLVNEQTPFDTKDIANLYYKKITDLKSYSDLILPFIDNSGYTLVTGVTNLNATYSSVLGNNPGYYEIIEQDGAGNTTQYVVYYYQTRNPLEAIQIPVTITEASTGEENKDIQISSLNQDPLYIYDISARTSMETPQDAFFKVQVKNINGTELFSQLTVITTDFNKLTADVVDSMKNMFGTYELIITTRKYNSVIYINIYDVENLIEIDVKDLVVKRENNYFIILNGANKTTEKDGNTLMFYATEISVKTDSENNVYRSQLSGREVFYINESGEVVNEIRCEQNKTYCIEMLDVLKNRSVYRFNTSGLDFVVVEFDDFGDEDFYDDFFKSEQSANTYYGFTNARIKYDKTIYTAKLYKKEDGQFKEKTFANTEVAGSSYNQYSFLANYENQGVIDEYRIDLFYNGTRESSYYINIDTRILNVVLGDYSTGEQKDIIKTFNNTNFDDAKVVADVIDSGIMNLQLINIFNNDYFDYEITLYETLLDGTIRETDLTETTNTVIATKEDSSGKYVVEVSVFAKNEFKTNENKHLFKLGNKLFVFEVKEVGNEVYFVTDESGTAIKANSKFNLLELGVTTRTIIQKKFDGISDSINYPLYITNQILTVNHILNIVKTVELVEDSTYYDFYVYQLKKENAYTRYLGILKVDTVSKIVSDITIAKEGETVQEINNEVSAVVTGLPSEKVTISATMSSRVTDKLNPLLKKNSIWIEVSYSNKFVALEEFDFYHYYEILGNGKYSFRFLDLAGNVHVIDSHMTDTFEVNVLREIVVLLNNESPVENEYYNNAVELIVYEMSKYVTGSVSIKATKNGVPYKYEGHNPYIFSDYGTYRVELSALYPDVDKKLTKVVTFTILNVKEARKSIDLTNLAGHKILSVKNQKGYDVTNTFLSIANSKSAGYNISYDDIMAKADELKITTGKQTFTISYEIEDKVYPVRVVEFSFTLNNEEPRILCSLQKGEKTNKSFTITFNAAVLYEQMGESYIYINNILVAHVDETSSNSEQNYTVSYKKNGDGDYYVKLVSSSGVVLDSFKVTIKEPLNFSSFIVILVIAGVVGTVVITIVVLRRKMRIR